MRRNRRGKRGFMSVNYGRKNRARGLQHTALALDPAGGDQSSLVPLPGVWPSGRLAFERASQAGITSGRRSIRTYEFESALPGLPCGETR